MELLYKNNQTVNFIKQLLNTTSLPIYKTVRIGDYVVEGTTYIYKDKIFDVLPGGSGMFDYKNALLFTGPLLPREDLVDIANIYVIRPGDSTEHPVYPTDSTDWTYYRRAAKIIIRGSYNWNSKTRNLTRPFRSNVSYYDSDTHKHLGDYLRCLRNIEDIDLMSLYNCFAGDQSYDYHIEDDYLVKNEHPQTNKKVYFVPVKFNKTYTIGFDCLQRFKVLPVLISDGEQVTKLNESLQPQVVTLDFITATYNQCSYKQPVTYVTSCAHPKHQLYEKYLYIAVEVPVDNKSPLVVLEGDFTQQCPVIVSAPAFVNSNKFDALTSIPSLLRNTDGKLHVISDKLISYLLEYTIDSRASITANVLRVENDTDFTDGSRRMPAVGQWSSALRYSLYSKYNMISGKYSLSPYDVLGYVDRDVDEAIRKGWLKDVK